MWAPLLGCNFSILKCVLFDNMLDGEYLRRNRSEGLPLLPGSCLPESTPRNSTEEWCEEPVSSAGGCAVSRQSVDAPESARQGGKQSSRPAQPRPARPHAVLAFISQAPHSGRTTRRREMGPGRWWAAREQSAEKKGLSLHSLLVPPALFSKNRQPAEGLCNFWWARQMVSRLGHIKPGTDTNLP